MTVAYMLKLFFALFIDRHPTRQAEFDAMSSSYMTPLSRTVLCGAAMLLPLLGILPYAAMDRLADLGQPFFHGVGTAPAVNYFSISNLTGGLISIFIGVSLYGLVLRPVLKYEDRWPAWLDLEQLIYRPVLATALPGIFGTICELLDRYLIRTGMTVFLAVSAVACRAMDQMADGAILLARKTTHRQQPEPKDHLEGNWLAWIAGTASDTVLAALDHLPGRRKRVEKRSSSVERMWDREARFKHMLDLVEESFSFGLMLFSIGLCVTLFYLLFVFLR